MKASEVYDRFIIKSEKNSTSDYFATDKQRFVELYNEAQIRMLEEFYEQKTDDNLRYINSLLVLDKRLDDFVQKRDFYSFKLPEDYFDYSSSYAIASKNSCNNKRIDLIKEIDDFNRPYHLSDEFTSPSFEYRETIYNIGNNSLNVYYKDFVIDSVSLSYYRYPKPIRLENPDNPESNFDDSYDLDFDEKMINRIVTRAVSNFDINVGSERWQIGHKLSQI